MHATCVSVCVGGGGGRVCANLWARSARVIKTGLSLLVRHGGDKRCRGRDATDLPGQTGQTPNYSGMTGQRDDGSEEGMDERRKRVGGVGGGGQER